MRTIIHIGQHKTGTTSLQDYLQSQRNNLLKKGLYVPDSLAGINHPSHYILNVFALDKERLSPMKEHLLSTKPKSFFDNLENKLTSDIEKHYKQAQENNCSDIIWSNEGLYLLNSENEYKKLLQLFTKHSDNIVCVCTFREKKSFRKSYVKQLLKQKINFIQTKDSYRYIHEDSWLFDYESKINLLKKVFKDTIFIDYEPQNMVKIFMTSIGYYVSQNIKEKHLNITDK
ncbi:hypothetical protein [uncultured Cocleimonas sp.]|uniref:hypothetical protein n=1 Tax=uncultured Cocleimonas sp. TaxID=1051587 RepID=UPI0026122B5D|nr:hypothetical protein [uncultured Cocleimonas sp.]